MQIVLGVFGVHIIVWAFLLIMSLTVGATDAFQRNCSSDLPIAYWSRVVGIVAMAHWAVMVLLWFLFLASLIKWSVKPKTKNKTEDEKKRYQRDPLEMYVRARAFELALHALMLPMYSLARLTHWPWLMDVVHPIKEGWSLKREIVRWSISSFFYFVWFSAYVSLYILALQRFVMVGDNPFDYGQVAACVVSPSSSEVFPLPNLPGRRRFSVSQGTLGGTITVVRCIVNESAYYRNRNETTHSNSFIHRLRNSVVGNKDVCVGDATGQNQLVEQSSDEGESSSSETSATNSRTHSSSPWSARRRPSTLASGPRQDIGRRSTSRPPPSEGHSSEEQGSRHARSAPSRRSTLSSGLHPDTGSRRASHRSLSAEDPSETLLGSQGPPVSSSSNQSASPPRGRSTRSRRNSSASNDTRRVSIIPGLREDGLAALRYAGEIPPRSHQALSPGRSVSSERSVNAPLLPRRSSSRASRRYLDRF